MIKNKTLDFHHISIPIDKGIGELVVARAWATYTGNRAFWVKHFQ